jgi:hypothetical protein
LAESLSRDEGEDGSISADQLQAYLAKVSDLPALASLLRFMNSGLFDRVGGELLDLGYAEEPDRSIQTLADMKLDPLEEAFDTFVAEISGEVVAAKLIHALNELTSARAQGDLARITLLESRVNDFRAAAAWFPAPEHLRSVLTGLGEETGE